MICLNGSIWEDEEKGEEEKKEKRNEEQGENSRSSRKGWSIYLFASVSTLYQTIQSTEYRVLIY